MYCGGERARSVLYLETVSLTLLQYMPGLWPSRVIYCSRPFRSNTTTWDNTVHHEGTYVHMIYGMVFPVCISCTLLCIPVKPFTAQDPLPATPLRRLCWYVYINILYSVCMNQGVQGKCIAIPTRTTPFSKGCPGWDSNPRHSAY